MTSLDIAEHDVQSKRLSLRRTPIHVGRVPPLPNAAKSAATLCTNVISQTLHTCIRTPPLYKTHDTSFKCCTMLIADVDTIASTSPLSLAALRLSISNLQPIRAIHFSYLHPCLACILAAAPQPHDVRGCRSQPRAPTTT